MLHEILVVQYLPYGNLTIRGSVLFDRNYAGFGGGAINLKHTTSEVTANVTIFLLNNKAYFGGAIYVTHGNISFRGETTSTDSHNIVDVCQSKFDSGNDITIFHKNIANRRGGAIRSLYSNIIVLCFELNVAKYGGVITLDANSKLVLTPVLAVSFITNNVSGSGGALHIQNINYPCQMESSAPSDCFLFITSNSTANISLSFVNNSAAYAGSTLFGGELNKCRLCYETGENVYETKFGSCSYYTNNALEMFMNISSISLRKNSLDNISSPAQSLKLCQSDDQNNSYEEVAVYHGEEFNSSGTK